MPILGLRAAALFFLFVLATVSASADDWVAEKLRGGVLTFVDGEWTQLRRDDIVPDGTLVRTQNNGFVTLVRGAEIVEVKPGSQIEIVDKDGRRYTTVRQWYGTVEIEAEVRNVEHFAVVNEHLAAVVKGTRFAVKSNDHGAEVQVTRGKVAVKDSLTGETVQVPAGETVTTSAEAPLVLDSAPSVVVIPASDAAPASTADDGVNGNSGNGTAGGNGNSGNGNSGNGGGNDGNGGHGNGHGQDNNGDGPGNNGQGNANGHNK